MTTRIKLRVVLYGGVWRHCPSEAAVLRRLQTTLGEGFERVQFVTESGTDPDVALEAEVLVFSVHRHGEYLRDALAEDLIRHLGPEYDSMVEVEVLDD